MQQQPTHRCSRCGTEASADQRFCSHCGAVLDNDTVYPTMTASEQNLTQVPPPPPPDVDQYSTFRQDSISAASPNAPTYYQQPDGGSFSPPYPGSPPNQPTPGYPVAPYAQAPQKDNTGKILGGIGCSALLLILLVLALCGGLSYGIYAFVSKSIDSAATATNSYDANKTSTTTQAGNAGSTNSTTNGTPAAAPAKTVPLNLNIKYSAVTYTIVDVKQAASFADDNETSKSGVVRVDLKEVNSASRSVIFSYADAVRLILPDGNSVPIQSSKNSSPPANGASQDNWLDFPAPLGTSTEKLVLRFGTAQQAQMDVPLVAGSNLAKYQDVTVKPNAVTNYGGLKWTLTAATLTWSGYDKQAENGKRSVLVTVSIDNPGTAYKSAYWGDYLRLKAGDVVSAPDADSTIPTGFAASSTGNTGTALFLVPQESKTFTMILLADKIEAGAPQATIDFHIP